MKVVFNTGRLYQPEGQVITAVYEPASGLVLFMDHSRGIAGEFEAYTLAYTNRELIDDVMDRYDRNQYRMSMDAMQLTRDPTIEPIRLRI